MSRENDRDEILERLWQLRERGTPTVGALRTALRGRFMDSDLAALEADGLVTKLDGVPWKAGLTTGTASDSGGIDFTPVGSGRAERLIRAHRIGERLIHDVMGREFESGACELEHILATEVVDGICTLLGHPRQCPHGSAIPEGECCRASASWVQKVVIPLTELAVGQSARVAWVYARSDQQLHRLDSLQIRPGSIVKLHQVSPSWVIECDGASIALDQEVAGNINVWLDSSMAVPEDRFAVGEKPGTPGRGPERRRGADRRLRFGGGRNS
jgi:DtxR family transcriptional regulator, Mn-dependent transcriptional regulator